jgi:PIN domain nuclease of toxin-antitoxin system
LKFLLDSEVIVWLIYSPDRLPDRIRDIAADMNHELLVSHASLWELLGKIGRGKLLLAGTSVDRAFQRIMDISDSFLPVTAEQIVASAKLPQHHHDPFDRVIIAQAIEAGLPVLSCDSKFSLYDIEVIWK